MDFKLHKLFIGLILVALVVSCTVTKRIHSNGYHIEWRAKRSAVNSESLEAEISKSSNETEEAKQVAPEGDDVSKMEKNSEEGTSRNVFQSTGFESEKSNVKSVVNRQHITNIVKSVKSSRGIPKSMQNAHLFQAKQKAYNGLLPPEDYLLRALYLAIIGVVFLGIGLLIILVLETDDIVGYLGLVCVLIGALGILLCVGNLFLALLSVVFG